MKTKNPPVYVGLDIAKASLQLHLQGHQFEFKNTPAGHKRLSQKLLTVTAPHVVCEATGGYERAVTKAFHQASILVSVVNPARVHAAIQAQGRRAKTDRIDAAALTDYGQRFQPEPTPPVSADQEQLTHLTLWVKQLIDARAVAKAQAEHHTDKFVRTQHAELLAHYTAQIALGEKKIQALIARVPALEQRVACLTELKGVGLRTAVMLLVHLPELGHLARGEAAALAGLAPWTRESGQMKGKSCIGGGRAEVRPVLYMSALSMIRCNPILKACYKGLRKRNKPGKVALTAVMRKLVEYLNHKLKAQAAQLAAETKTAKKQK